VCTYEFTNITEFEMPAHVAALAHFANKDTHTHVHISHILAIYVFVYTFVHLYMRNSHAQKVKEKNSCGCRHWCSHSFVHITNTNTYICKSTHMSAQHRSWFARTRSFALSWLCGRQTCVFYTLTHTVKANSSSSNCNKSCR